MGNIGNGWVYLVRHRGLYKIGSTTHVDQRLAELRNQLREEGGRYWDSPLVKVKEIDCINHELTERQLHLRFQEQRMRRLMPRGGEQTEWFDLTEDQVAYISSFDVAYEDTFADPQDTTYAVPRSIRITGETHRSLDRYVARQNRRIYPHRARTTKQQVVEAAIIEYLSARGAMHIKRRVKDLLSEDE